MTNHNPSSDRLIELLSDKATQGLTTPEQRELDGMGTPKDVARETAAFELAAAAADLASFETDRTSLPLDVRDRLLISAGQHFVAHKNQDSREPQSDHPLNTQQTVERSQRTTRQAGNWREVISLLAAAAAIGFLLFNGASFWPEPTVDSQWASLVSKSDTKETSWVWAETLPGDIKMHPNGKNIAGSIVWNQADQQGVMHLENLPVNNPKDYQYQLWIFESADQEAPIDGGVFNITSADQKILIDAKTRVNNEPVLYAITMEKPGGVPRSDRSRLPVVAPVSSD